VKLRIDGELRGADLSRTDLAGVTLENQDLRCTSFSGARLVGADHPSSEPTWTAQTWSSLPSGAQT